MGGKTSTTTQKVEIPPEVLARYNAVNARAEDVAKNPFQMYGTQASDFVAQLNNQQLSGMKNVNAAAGSYKPYISAATDATKAGMASAQPGQLNIDQYMNPFQQQVIDATMARMAQEQEQQQSGALGTAISSGAFGGDRAGIAAANLAQQQGMATGATLAGLNAQNYQQALATAQQQQGLQLGAEQADLARLLSGGQQLAGLGQANQAMGLQGAEAQINAGTLAQQTEQAGISALYNQFQQMQAYPFQVAQFLANIAMGTGALSGSTTTTTQPAPFWSDRRLKHDIKRIGKSDNGLPIYTFKYKGDPEEQTHVGFMADEVEKRHPEAVGLAPNGYKYVDYDRAAKADGGGVAGPYGAMVGSQPGAGSYVPQAYLPVGELMVADGSVLSNSQRSMAEQLAAVANLGESIKSIDETWKWAKDNWGNKEREDILSGVESARGGSRYASGGAAYLETSGLGGANLNPVSKDTYLSDTVKGQEEGKKNQLMQPGAAPSGQSGGGLGGLLSGIGSAASGIAAILPFLSDRRAKHSIRRIGQTDHGMPIYSFKYKGDDRERTHIGFMADEVERDHPDAVMIGPDGMKRVDYGQAHKFYQGGVVRPGYADGGGPESEEEIARRRLLASDVPAAATLGTMPDARITSAATEPQIVHLGDVKGKAALPPVETFPTPPREPMADADLTGLAAAAIDRSASPLAPEVSRRPVTGLPAEGSDYRSAAKTFARMYDVPEDMFLRLVGQESSYNPDAVSPDGALGLAQLMPGTAKELGVDPSDPMENLKGGAQYLRQMYDRFGNWDMALAAYNAGPGRLSSAIDRATALGGSYVDYLPDETKNYISIVGSGKGLARVAGSQSGDQLQAEPTGLAGGRSILTSDKPYGDRTTIGKMFYNPDGTVNRDALLSIASGIGAMLSSPSQFLLPSIGLGLQGAASTYAGLEQQRGDVTAKNIENAEAFQRAYLRAMEYGFSGTPEDYAQSIRYTGPISLTGGLIGVKGGNNGSAVEFMGAPLDPFGRGMNKMISVPGPDGAPVQVMAGQTLGYLKALETKLSRDVEMGIASPGMLEQVRSAIAGHTGQITTGDGKTIADPTSRDVRFGAAGQASDAETSIQLTKELPAISQGAYEARRNTNELADALSQMPTTGNLSPWISTFGNIATQLGIVDSSDAATGYEKAIKVISSDIENSMAQLGGSVDTSVLANAVRNARPGPNMTPGAIEELLAVRAGIADYQIARSEALNRARRDPNANLAQVDREFAYNNPVEEFVDARRPQYKGTIGAASSLQKPEGVSDARWSVLTDEEKRIIVGGQ